jgi:hypothetical protein
MATDAEKVKMYREKAKDTSVPQEVRNTYLDRANELERKAFEATKVPEKKMAVGGVAFNRANPAGGKLDGGGGPMGVAKPAVMPKDKTKPMPQVILKKPRPTPKPRAPVNPVKVQNKPKPFTAPYPQVSPTAIDGPAFAKGGVASKKPMIAIMIGVGKPTKAPMKKPPVKAAPKKKK